MGLLSFFSGKASAYDAEATLARVAALKAAMPEGADVNATPPSRGVPLNYYVDTVSDRAHTSALLAAIVEVVKADEGRWSIDLAVQDTEDQASTFSSISLPSSRVDLLEDVRRAHDELYALVPTQSILLDTSDGSFVVSDVPAESALTTARAVLPWWEGVLSTTIPPWYASNLSVDIGGDGINADITYSTTIEREPIMERERRSGRAVSDADWVAQVFETWTENLPLLEAMLQLPVPAHHAVDFSFSSSKLRPRLSVTHHDTCDEDEAAAQELVAAIRAQVPATKLKVG